MNIVELNLDKFSKLCAKHKVTKLFVVGSVLKDSFHPESDIDLVVDFDNDDLAEYADNNWRGCNRIMKHDSSIGVHSWPIPFYLSAKRHNAPKKCIQLLRIRTKGHEESYKCNKKSYNVETDEGPMRIL